MRIKKLGAGLLVSLALAACCLARPGALRAADPDGRLLLAQKQVELQYFSPAKAGLEPAPGHKDYIERTLGGILQTRALAQMQAADSITGRLEFEWLTADPNYPVPVLYAEFSAKLLGSGTVEEVVFTGNNFKEWSSVVGAALGEYKKNTAANAALASALAALKARGFVQASLVPVFSWEEGIAAGLQPPAWTGLPFCAPSPDGLSAKAGIMAADAGGESGAAARRHYFTVIFSAYEPVAGKWLKAEVISMETWEGFRPQGKKTGFSAESYPLW